MDQKLSEGQLKALKECELSMLRCFIEICDRLELKYFLVGGTLLGAVRHGGFIPWDDDIDVGMLRGDYEVFLKEAPGLLPDYYFLQTRESDKEFPYNCAKIRDNRTCFIESQVKNVKINHGVFIDVFPFDNYPENEFKGNIMYFKKKFLTARVERVFFFEKPKVYTFLGKVRIALACMLYKDINKALDKRERLYTSVPASSKVTNFCGAWGKKEVVPKKWVAETTKLKFEDIEASCPKYYKEYLTNVYGDYMKLPPVEKQVGHHYTEVVDLEKSYLDYVK